jgi:hypothetical protein
MQHYARGFVLWGGGGGGGGRGGAARDGFGAGGMSLADLASPRFQTKEVRVTRSAVRLGRGQCARCQGRERAGEGGRESWGGALSPASVHFMHRHAPAYAPGAEEGGHECEKERGED